MVAQLAPAFDHGKDSKEPVLIDITREFLPRFGAMLKAVKKADPFVRSPGYYAITGRKGLWLYGDQDTAMVIARHPNKKDTILLFPPFGRDPAGLVRSALKDHSLPAGEKQLSRVGADDAHLAMRLQVPGDRTLEREDTLDWAYPVHSVSAQQIIERKGGAFNNLRSHVNQAFRAGYTAHPIDPVRHADAIKEVVTAWANDGRKKEFQFDDLTGPTETALSLMADKALPLHGLLVFDQDKPVGFWIWDESDKPSGTAASLVRISIGDRGAAEFAAVKMAEQLQARGFETMCLGGSETESLDHFKRKLCPVQSVELKTMHLTR